MAMRNPKALRLSHTVYFMWSVWFLQSTEIVTLHSCHRLDFI